MAVPAIVPTPTRITVRDGSFRLTAESGVDGPPAVTDLLRELLGLPLPTGSDVRFRLVDGLAPEAYTLSVDEGGVVATASTEAGLRWAIQTLRQLADDDMVLPFVTIEDEPRLPWRGALLDVLRG